MPLRDLFSGSQLGIVGIFLLGSVYATQSGMGAVFGTQIGMTADRIALFVAKLFAGALVLQYPIGWLSGRIDRRNLIFGASALGAACALRWITGGGLWSMMTAAFLAGGVTTPLYVLFLEYTNDYLPIADMAAASGGRVFTFGLGAIVGPLVTGWAMYGLGPFAFWLVLGATFGALCALPHDEACDGSGRPERKLPWRVAHSLVRGGRGGRRLGRRTGRGANARPSLSLDRRSCRRARLRPNREARCRWLRCGYRHRSARDCAWMSAKSSELTRRAASKVPGPVAAPRKRP